MSDGLAWIGDDLGFAVVVQVNNVDITAAQKDDDGVISIHVRRKVHLLLHVGMLEANLGHRRGTAEGFVDESEDGLGVVLSDSIDELFAGKLVECKALGDEVAVGSPLLLMMGGLGVEVIEGVLLLAHLQKTLDGILGDDVVLLVEEPLGITTDRFDDFVSEAAVVVSEAATGRGGLGALGFLTLRGLRALRVLRALAALQLTNAPCGFVSVDFRRDQSEDGNGGDEKGRARSKHAC